MVVEDEEDELLQFLHILHPLAAKISLLQR